MNLKDTVKAQALAAGYNFAYGTRLFTDLYKIENDLKDGAVVIDMLPYISNDVFNDNGLLSEIEYSTFFFFSRKFEVGETFSNMDETYEQKEDNRLEDLREIARQFIDNFICANKVTAKTRRMQGEINRGSSNFDGINVEFIFSRETIFED